MQSQPGLDNLDVAGEFGTSISAREWTEFRKRVTVKPLVLKWSTQKHASRIKKTDIRSYLWLGSSLTNLHLPESVLIVTQMIWGRLAVGCWSSVLAGACSRVHRWTASDWI